MANEARIRSYREFWPLYVAEHRRRMTRHLHFIGTTGAILCALAAAAWGEPWLLLAALVVAYSLAWLAHLFIERNRPATSRARATSAVNTAALSP